MGVYSPNVPSVFISHQLHYHLPLMLWPVELLGIWMNGFLHSKFRKIIIPDNPPGPLSLAGKLSQAGTGETGRGHIMPASSRAPTGGMFRKISITS